MLASGHGFPTSQRSLIPREHLPLPLRKRSITTLLLHPRNRTITTLPLRLPHLRLAIPFIPLLLLPTTGLRPSIRSR